LRTRKIEVASGETVQPWRYYRRDVRVRHRSRWTPVIVAVDPVKPHDRKLFGTLRVGTMMCSHSQLARGTEISCPQVMLISVDSTDRIISIVHLLSGRHSETSGLQPHCPFKPSTIFSANGLAEVGFWPVYSLPSTATWDCISPLASYFPPSSLILSSK
jgi:hypothetical protein